MGTIWRTADRALLRDVGAIAAAAAAIGVSFGAIATAAGLPWWLVVAMSVLVFAGGAQFLAVGLLAAGNPVAALFAGLLLNARHLPFGFALASKRSGEAASRSGEAGARPGEAAPPRLAGVAEGSIAEEDEEVVGRRWPARLLGSHLMIDESVAFAMAQPDPGRRRSAYWLTGIALFVVWNLGTGLGVLLGGAVADPAALGLDAAFPAGLLALLWPSLRDPTARRVALAGGAVALLTTPVLPAGAPVLLALTGLATVAVRRRSQSGVAA